MTDGERERLAALEAEVQRLQNEVAVLRLWKESTERGVKRLLANER